LAAAAPRRLPTRSWWRRAVGLGVVPERPHRHQAHREAGGDRLVSATEPSRCTVSPAVSSSLDAHARDLLASENLLPVLTGQYYALE
jgi:hypothetical protein